VALPEQPHTRRIGDPRSATPLRILVALSDPTTAGDLAAALRENRLSPTLVFSCEDVLHHVNNQAYGLVIIDRGFTCDHAPDCLDQTRRRVSIPILLLTGGAAHRDENADAVVALDDHPEIGQLAKSLIRMSRPSRLPGPIAWGKLELDTCSLQARWGDRPLRLTVIQFRIMEVLALAGGDVVTLDELSRRVWGDAGIADRDRLVAHVRRIRKLIEEDPSKPRFLLRLPGAAFRLCEAPA
jgi:DNA-binding response OmpR family regulator